MPKARVFVKNIFFATSLDSLIDRNKKNGSVYDSTYSMDSIFHRGDNVMVMTRDGSRLFNFQSFHSFTSRKLFTFSRCLCLQTVGFVTGKRVAMLSGWDG